MIIRVIRFGPTIGPNQVRDILEQQNQRRRWERAERTKQKSSVKKESR